VTEKIGTREGGLGPLLVEIRKARAETMADPRAKVSAARLDRWAESIEAFLENVGQGTPSKGAFPRDDRSTTHNPAKILLDAPRAQELSARSKRAEARELHGGCASSSA
jgi:hypothetical protein